MMKSSPASQTGAAGIRILVADALNERANAILAESGMQTETRTGLGEDALCAIIGDYDGLIVRSATQVTSRVIAAGPRLKVIGRAGVGVDNVDLEAATAAGIVVQNTPFGNITSAAEHALALLFASARHVCRADREMKAGKWNKKGLVGVELNGKTLGIVGMGKVGAIVARVAAALQMTVLVYDPHLTDRKAEELGVRKTDLDSLLRGSEFLSVHAPLTNETKDLIAKHNLALLPPSARIVNAARGGIINENDLCEALRQGRIAGAALDVYETEPLPADSPLRSLDTLLLTPHLGASTIEAQERVSEDIARQFVEFFRDGVIRNAVNLTLTLDPKLAPYAHLAEKFGSMVAQLADAPIARLTVGVYGKIASGDTREISLCALKGVLVHATATPVTLVNAANLAEDRGITLVERKSEQIRNYVNFIEVQAETVAADGRTDHLTIAGTCFDGQEGHIRRIQDMDIDLKPAPHILLMFYPDRPGVVGKVGTMIGQADINIANMAVGRREKRGQAALALTLDDPASPELVRTLQQAVGVDEIYSIELP